MIGQEFGHYRVVEKLGEGGMGVVYRATDTRLGRDVALKVLPDAFARDAERMARFEREARLLASLNHPNIAAIYGLEESAGVRAIAMELVDGHSLADRLRSGPIPLEEALPIALQIADALEAAHDKGIIHRDLKPANVKVTADGKVKVLDFGLAKALVESAAVPDLAASPTISEMVSKTGIILGTAAYMSPEQARGKPLDKRTDVWSFGCLLYEMLAGNMAFRGDTVSDSIAYILGREPDWNALPERTSPGVHRALRRCLQKDPQRRLRDIADVRLELEETQSASTSLPEPTGEAGAGLPAALFSRRGWIWQAGLMVLALSAGAVLGMWTRSDSVREPTAQSVRKFQVPLEGQPNSIPGQTYIPVISPDGQMVVYFQAGKLWIRDLDQLKSRELPDTIGATLPFWSPDSRFVAYYTPGALRKIPAKGGIPQTICEITFAGIFLGGTWGTAESIVVAFAGNGMYEASAGGGILRPFLLPDRGKGEFDFHYPSYLPDGRSLLYIVHPLSGYQYSFWLRTGNETRKLIPSAEGRAGTVVYSATGHLVFSRTAGGSSIYAVPFSMSDLKDHGDPVPLIVNATAPSVSADGTLAYFSGGMARPEELVLLDRSGKVMKSIGEPFEQIRSPAFSPDGRRIAFMGVRDGNHDLWMYDIERGSTTRLTSDPNIDEAPIWSASGNQIAFGNGQWIAYKLNSLRADGSGEPTPIMTKTITGAPFDWSPDGKYFVYEDQSDVWLLDLAKRSAAPLLRTPGRKFNMKISPNGRYIAYTSDVSGREEIYVQPFPEGEGRWLISTNGGTLPRWGRRGNELFYVEGMSLMSVTVQFRAVFAAGRLRVVFNCEESGVALYSFSSRISAYDAAPDGTQFVAVRRVPGPPDAITFVENWAAALKSAHQGTPK